MDDHLQIELVRSEVLPAATRSAIIALCNRAYGEDLGPLFETFPDPTHVLGYHGGALVSHAMWVTRWLQPGDGPILRTAYVELVATEPAQERRGFASAVMRRLAAAISAYDLGALSAAVPELYARLGWVFWRGPLLIRSDGGLLPTPEEQVMILRLPGTPPLDLDVPLSAEWRPGELW